MQQDTSDDTLDEHLEWKITRVDSEFEHNTLTSSYGQPFKPSNLFPAELPDQTILTFEGPTMIGGDESNSKSSLPRLNLAAIQNTESKSEVNTSRSGFLTAREPSPIILSAREQSPETPAMNFM